MALIRSNHPSGHRSALVVVDVQAGVMAPSWDAARVVGQVARAVDKARTAGVPVLWVQHDSDELPRGSAPWQLVPELKPLAGELRVDKRHPSSFEDTSLASTLQALGVNHVVLAGAQTNWCIRATAYAALERGYDLTLLKDAHTTESIDLGDGTRLEASTLIHDLNIVMRWLSYPGRRNAVATVDELDFAAPAATG